MMYVKYVAIALLFALSGCENYVEQVIREKKNCETMGGSPSVDVRPIRMHSGTYYELYDVKCKFKEQQ